MKQIRFFCNVILRIINILFSFNWQVHSFQKFVNIAGRKHGGVQINVLFRRKIVGRVYLTEGWYYSAEHSPYAIMYSLFVSVVFRRLGIGKILIEQSIKRCKEKELKELIVLVNNVNKGAITFYKKIGFIDAERGLYSDMYKLEISKFEEIFQFSKGSQIVMVIPI